MSPGLIPEAAMRMRISPGPGAGSGISPMVRTSLAGPCFSYQAALMESSISQKSRTAQFNPNSLILAAECFQAEVAQYREVGISSVQMLRPADFCSLSGVEMI